MSAQFDMVEQAKVGIAYHARECEDALRLASVADSEPAQLPSGIGNGLRRLATYHSDHAFCWARSLTVAGGA